MKLLIQQDLHWSSKFDPSLSAEELANEREFFEALKDLAKRFSLWGKYEILDDSVDFRIHAQKVTVDEVAMNEFFADFLTELFKVEVQYAALGGAGCDFALELTEAEPVGQYVSPTTADTVQS